MLMELSNATEKSFEYTLSEPGIRELKNAAKIAIEKIQK